MHRFFVKKQSVLKDRITLSGEDVRHISKVLRLKCGDRIVLCDGEGTDYIAAIESMVKDSIGTVILEKESSKGSRILTRYCIRAYPSQPKWILLFKSALKWVLRESFPYLLPEL